MFKPDAWQAVSPYLDQALEMEDAERAVWLQSLRHDNPSVAAQIENLLEEHRELHEKGFLEQAPQLPPGQGAAAGQSVGAYTLLAPIGEGGMGTVWLAERSDGRFQRRVALKEYMPSSLAARAGDHPPARVAAALLAARAAIAQADYPPARPALERASEHGAEGAEVTGLNAPPALRLPLLHI